MFLSTKSCLISFSLKVCQKVFVILDNVSSIRNGGSEFTVGNIGKGKKNRRKVSVSQQWLKLIGNTFVSTKLSDKKDKFLCYRYIEATDKNPSNIKILRCEK